MAPPTTTTMSDRWRNAIAFECHAQNRPVPLHLLDEADPSSPSAPSSPSLLDGSLKKNAAMVNKLKSITAENAPKLCVELRKLRVDKFIQEFVTSLTEAALATKSKQQQLTDADIHGIVQVCAYVRLPWTTGCLPYWRGEGGSFITT